MRGRKSGRGRGRGETPASVAPLDQMSETSVMGMRVYDDAISRRRTLTFGGKW